MNLGQSQAAQEQRGPIDRPRRDGDRDRDSVCVLPRVHRRRRRRPRRVCLPVSSPPNPSPPSLARLSSTRATAPIWGCSPSASPRERRRTSPATRSRPPSPTGPPPPTRRRPSPPFGPEGYRVPLRRRRRRRRRRHRRTRRASPRVARFRASGGSIQPTGAHPAQQRRRRHGRFPPGRRGGGAFRGALLPALGCGPVGVAATGAAFGALHVGRRRNWAFAGWAAGWGCLAVRRPGRPGTSRWPCWHALANRQGQRGDVAGGG